MPRPAPPAATLPWRGALSFLIIGVAALAMSVLTTAIRANPATTTGPDYSDLVLSLTFDGDSGSTVVDSSKYQHNGTATGTTVTDGKFGNGRSFNGTSDYLVIPHADPLSPTSAITVEAWVYLDTTNTAMKILQKRGVFSDTSGGYMLGAWFGNPRGYAFEVYDSNQHIVYPSPENSPPTQIWTHVAATFDGSAIKLYKDGAIQNTVAWSGALTRSTKDLWIGMQPDNSLMPFKGKMDEIRIYNRALSAEEVSCSYEGKVWLSGSCQASSSNRPPAVVSMVGPTTATAGIQQTWTVKVHDPDTGRLTYDVDWGESGVAHSTEAVPSPQLTNNSQTFSHVYQTAGTFTPRVTVTDPSGVTASLSASSVTVAAPADTQAPGISTNLVAEETTITSTRIAWLAPSDNVGVTSYQVRYRQGISFADVDWLGATDAGTVPSTVAAGQRVSTVLSNLAAGTDYGVGVKACDAASNCSTIAAMQFRTGASVGEDGLLGHWKFDGNGTNEIAGGPSAATAGNAAFRSSGGKLVGYAYLSATGDSVRIPNRSTFDLPNTFTVALWFRQRADRGFLQDLVLKGAGQNNYSFRVFRQLWNQYNFGPIITGYTSSRTGYWTQTSNPNQLSHNEWHHVVFTKDATQSAYYLDGSLIHSSQQTDPAVMTTEDIVVGGTAVDTDVDDLRIYNRALSATEARELGGFPALDTQAPGIPTYVLAEETTATSTRIAWLASSDNVGVTSYEVRYRQGTSFASVDWAGATATSAIPSTVAAGQRVSTVLSGLAANTDYAAGVKACDAANNCSTIAAATFRTLGTTSGGADTQPPQAPTDLTVTSVAQTEIGLRWSVPSDNVGVAKFSIRKKTGTTAFTEVEWATAPLIAEIPSTERIVGTVLFTPLTGFTQNTQYVVGMKACDAAGNCSPTASVPFRTVEDAAGAHADTQPPTPPGSPAMSAITTTEATVTWSPATDAVGVARYEIRYRVGPVFAEADWASANGSVGVVWASTGQRSHLLSGLTSGTQYTAAIKAYDAAGNESPLASVTFRASGTTSTTTTTTGTTTTTTTTGTGTTTSGGGGGGGGGTTTTGTTTGTTSTTTTTTGTATLRVIVRDAASAMVSGAFVGIGFPGGGVASPTMTTGADGIVVFSNVAAGSYHLGISPPATRADLGSVTNHPVALAIGSTTETSIALPVRTQTTTATTGATAAATQLCGTVSDPDRNILSGITVGLSQSGTGTASLGMSVVTGADGRYCFANLAPGTYVVGAMTPAHRMDLTPPGTAMVSLAAGTTGNQDLFFGRASTTTVVSGIPSPTPQPVAAPLPAIERCVRDAFGADLYDRMRTGKYKPKQGEYERAKHCFNLTVIVDHRPVETPIGAPAVPSPVPSIIVLPGSVIAPPSVRPPEFDDRCEVRELPRVKRGVQQLTREFDRIDRELTRLRTAKVDVPTDTGLLLIRARDLLSRVAKATTCEDAFAAGEELPDLMGQLRTSIDRVSRLRFAPRVLTSFDREVKRFLDRTRTGIRRLERAKFTVAEFQGRLAEAEGQLKECRASGATALAVIDPELFEDTMRSCFEILDEAREIQSLVDALANVRAFLTGTVEATLRKANRVIRDLERAKKDVSEVKQFAAALRQQRDEALAAVRRAGLAKDELVDLVEDTIAAFGDLDDAFERALGTTTYEEIVGKAPPPAIATPKLEKSTEEFFERE